jgi:hypothetical protein
MLGANVFRLRYSMILKDRLRYVILISRFEAVQNLGQASLKAVVTG